MSRLTPLFILALAGCTEPDPQIRREQMTDRCISYTYKPIECANAAEIAIPRKVTP